MQNPVQMRGLPATDVRIMEKSVPTLAEFVQKCRAEFRFLVKDFGFREAPCSNPSETFCVRFENNDRSLEIRGEGYGSTAGCHLTCGSKGPLAIIDMVPEAFRPKRSRKRDRMGQLDRIRECAELARTHATDFLSGDAERFARIWDRERTLRRRRQVTT